MEEGGTRTVLLGDGRDPDRYLRVTWHPDSGTVVFSHWHGAVCAASSAVPVSEASRLGDLLSAAMRPVGGSCDDTVVTRLPRRAAVGGSRSGTHEGGE